MEGLKVSARVSYSLINMRPGAKLGQHFLRSQKTLTQIIAAADLKRKDVVLEIGPGKGILTKELLLHADKVIAIEKDTLLVEGLRSQFQEEIEQGKLILIEQDVRDFNISNSNLPLDYKLIANIPYYITGELLRTFLSIEKQPQKIVFLVQKEVAERIARNQKESILSLSVKAYGEPKYVATVPKSAFSPPPKVDSAILLTDHISRKNFKKIDEQHFFKIIKSGFAQKRKILKRNLEKVASSGEIATAFEALGFDENVRAEDIPLDTWIELTKKLSFSNGVISKQST